jgi:hypothetical protein
MKSLDTFINQIEKEKKDHEDQIRKEKERRIVLDKRKNERKKPKKAKVLKDISKSEKDEKKEIIENRFIENEGNKFSHQFFR